MWMTRRGLFRTLGVGVCFPRIPLLAPAEVAVEPELSVLNNMDPALSAFLVKQMDDAYVKLGRIVAEDIRLNGMAYGE